jgi:hypothetical protein
LFRFNLLREFLADEALGSGTAVVVEGSELLHFHTVLVASPVVRLVVPLAATHAYINIHFSIATAF